MLRIRPFVHAFVFLCMAFPLYAQIKTHFYYSEHFGIPEGLDHGVIGDFRIDEHGFVWIYTQGSFQRFDGKRFMRVEHPIEEPAFGGYFNSSGPGGIYFLSQTSIYRLDKPKNKDGTAAVIKLTNAPNVNHRLFMLYESDTHLYIANPPDSVYQVQKADLKLERRFKLPIPVNYYYSLNEFDRQYAIPHGLEYIGVDNVVYRYDTGSQKADTISKTTSALSGIKVARDTFLILSQGSLSLVAPGYERHLSLPDSTQPFRSRALLKISPHEVLVVLYNGIFTLDYHRMEWISRFKKTGDEDFFDINIRALQKDPDGNLYLSTFTSGLVKLYPRNPGFEYIGALDADKRFVRNISGSDIANVILMGTLMDGLYVYDTSGHLLRHFREYPDRDANPYITAIIKVSPWKYYFLAGQLYKLEVKGRDIQISHADDIGPEIINYYCAAIPGNTSPYYLPSWNGLITIDPDSPKPFGYRPGHPTRTRFAATHFRDGFLATGFDTMVWMDERMEVVKATYVLPPLRYHRCILAENDSTILLGTDTGLYRVSIGEKAVIKERLYDKLVYAILQGNQPGGYWISTDYGLFRVGRDGALSQYSIETGVQENEFNTNACYKSENGKLYFGGINGITAFYPSLVTRSADTIRPYITTVSVNNTIITSLLMPPDHGNWQFSHDQANIGIELLGKGKRAPESYNYQYKIPELSNDWVDMSHESRIQFHLKPGSYTFYYHISNQFDPQAKEDHHITWVIHPPFYRQWWFVTIGIMAVMSILAYLVHLNRKRRELRMRYEYQLDQQLQHERMRISRELHDNIGAQMATVKRSLNFLITNNDLLTADQSLQKMKDLEGISSRINQELRDTIWANQHAHISIGDFIARLKHFVFQMLGQESSCRVLYEEQGDTTAVMGPFVALNLHRICQEAINNIVKHAMATEMIISFMAGPDHFSISITDNGKGYNADDHHDGNGLRNIRHRAEQIGARVIFERPVQGGSRLVIHINTLVLTEKTMQ